MNSGFRTTTLHTDDDLDAREPSAFPVAPQKTTALLEGRIRDDNGVVDQEHSVRNATAMSNGRDVGSTKSSIVPVVTAMMGVVPDFLHHIDDLGQDMVADSERAKWKAVDPQWWGSKYVCFVHMQMLLWTMSRSPAVTENDGCAATGTSQTLKNLLHNFSRKAKNIADRLWLSKQSDQSNKAKWSQDLIAEAGTVLSIIAQLLTCFLNSASSDGADRVMVRAREASTVIQKYTHKRMDYIGMELATSTTAARPGSCDNSTDDWAMGSWRIVCTTEDACTFLGLTSGSVYTVSDVYWFAWLGGLAGKSYGMRLGDVDAPFPKHSASYISSYAPTWVLKCVDGLASNVSLDDGKTWFTWSGEQYVYVAEFSDATDPEWRFTSTFLNAYIEKVTWGNSIRIATSTNQVS
jgi:hypothetical protein